VLQPKVIACKVGGYGKPYEGIESILILTCHHLHALEELIGMHIAQLGHEDQQQAHCREAEVCAQVAVAGRAILPELRQAHFRQMLLLLLLF